MDRRIEPGSELDALVADKIMGLNVSWLHEDKDYTKHGGLPKYSTDIAAAWTVVEKIYNKNKGEPMVMQIYGPLSDGYKVTLIWEHHDGPIEEGSIVAKTASHAICLAALKAVSYEVKDE